MGEARRRGDFEQRKAQAIQVRRIKNNGFKKQNKSLTHHELLGATMMSGLSSGLLRKRKR